MNGKKEKCVVCGKETLYNVEQHVDTRFDYIEGVGQLCPRCYNNTYDCNIENKRQKDDIYRNNNFSLN